MIQTDEICDECGQRLDSQNVLFCPQEGNYLEGKITAFPDGTAKFEFNVKLTYALNLEQWDGMKTMCCDCARTVWPLPVAVRKIAPGSQAEAQIKEWTKNVKKLNYANRTDHDRKEKT